MISLDAIASKGLRRLKPAYLHSIAPQVLYGAANFCVKSPSLEL